MIIVIGVFDRFAQAGSAKNELLASGFAWNQVQLNPDHEPAARNRTSKPSPGDTSLRASIGGLFEGLLGGDRKSSYGDLFGVEVRHGDYVLIAEAGNDERREHAEQTMRRHGAREVRLHRP